MDMRRWSFASEMAWVLGAIVALSLTALGHAHPGHSGPPPAAQAKRYGIGASAPAAPRPPEPYNGQVYCPVTGDRIGAMGQPVPVETGIGVKHPTAWGKFIGQKPTNGLMIYVCCPECAAKVKADPAPYVAKVIAERSQGSAVRASSEALPVGKGADSAVQPSRWTPPGVPAAADRPKGSC